MLIFRALTYVLPIPIGLATYVFWRRNRSWRRAPNSRAAHRTGAGDGVTAPAPPRPPALARGWPDVGAARRRAPRCCVLAALPVRPGSVSGAEAAVFRVLNGTTVLPFVVVWPVMQLGNVLVVPVVAPLLAAAFRRWRLAAELLRRRRRHLPARQGGEGDRAARPAARAAVRRGDPRRGGARPRLRLRARRDAGRAGHGRLAVAGAPRAGSPSSCWSSSSA